MNNPLLGIGSPVAHAGESIGKITDLRRNIANGRLYALVKPHEPSHHERRIPLDELTLEAL
jgi:hypothetical protein